MNLFKADKDPYVRIVEDTAEALEISFAHNEPLFLTDTPELFDVYYHALGRDQYHNCHECKSFISRYGSLVRIRKDGSAASVLWGNPTLLPQPYRTAIERLRNVVESAPVKARFFTSARRLGVRRNNDWVGNTWHHWHLNVPAYRRVARGTEDRLAAEYAEAYVRVSDTLLRWSPRSLAMAIELLSTSTRPEKVVTPARWLSNLAHTVGGMPEGPQRWNTIHFYVSRAPEGFTHPASSVWAPLADAVRDGTSTASALRALNERLCGDRYQRPVAPPKSGTIDRAERLFEDMGLAPALERRFATLREVTPHMLWTPKGPINKPNRRPRAVRHRGSGVFDQLRPRDAVRERAESKYDALPRTMTLAQFERDVLDSAARIELMVPARGAFAPILTAVHPDAPPILAWDDATLRNPFSHYVWVEGALARQFDLVPHTYVDVVGYGHRPDQWRGRLPQFNPNARIMLLRGARETNLTGGIGLFPETLRRELHEVRTAIERYSNLARPKPAPRGQAPAAGLILEGVVYVDVRVWTQHGVTMYVAIRGGI